jgi:hypothetical protein
MTNLTPTCRTNAAARYVKLVVHFRDECAVSGSVGQYKGGSHEGRPDKAQTGASVDLTRAGFVK